MSKKQQRIEQSELQEQRLLGLAPLARDVVSGQELGVNVPSTFTEAPWFYDAEGPTLAHQRMEESEKKASDQLDDSYLPSTKDLDAKKKKFKPGACENCGSVTHKLKECTMPRRKVGAKSTREVIGADRVVDDPSAGRLTFEQKRDRWAGKEDSHAQLWKIQEKKEAEDEQEQAKMEDMTEEETRALRRKKEQESDHSSRAALGSALRDQDELPKYLQTESDDAYYDPRTRSMREAVATATGYKGDNALNFSGQHREVNEQRVFLYKRSLEEAAGEREVGSSKSSILATTSMFLPTANEEDFRKHKEAIGAKKEREEKTVETLYGPSKKEEDECCNLGGKADVEEPEELPF